MFRGRGQIWARICVLAGALALIGGCNNNGGINPVVEGDSDEDNKNQQGWVDPYPPPAPWNELTWTESIVQSNQEYKAGYQGDLVRGNDGTLYYVYWKFQGDGERCDIAAFGGGAAPNLRYDLIVAVKAPGATAWTLEPVPLEDVNGSLDIFNPDAQYPESTGPRGYAVTMFGIDAEIDADDNLVVAVAAGGTALYTCGSAELVLATRTGENAYNVEVAVNSGDQCCNQRGGPAPIPADLDLECCLDRPGCIVGAGDTGGDVGAWAALAVRSDGTRAIAYTDQHNLGVLDGMRQAGLEYWVEGAVTGIHTYSGWGQYADLIWAGDTPIVAYTGYARSGLQVRRRVGTANSCVDRVNDWEEADLGSSFSSFKIGERIRFAEAPNGTIGMVFHAQENNIGVVNDLYLCETQDTGANWGCASIDASTPHLGGYPSLAYDKNNNPMVAYHYCGSAECPASSDGVRFAVRLNSRWYRFTVHSVRTSRSGFYTGLVVDPETDEPTVVFQDLTHGAAVAYHGHLP